MLVLNASEASRKVVRASILHYPIACSSMYSSVPVGIFTTVAPPCSPMRTSILSWSEISYAVGACPFGGGATILAGLATIPMSSSFRWRKAAAIIVLAVTTVRPREMSPMYAKTSTPFHPNFSLSHSTDVNAVQNNAGPMGSPVLDGVGARDRPGFPGVHPQKHTHWSCAV